MPCYTFRCLTCGNHCVEVRKVGDRDAERRCGDCGDYMERYIGNMPGVTYRCDGMTLQWPGDVGRAKMNWAGDTF